MTERRLLFDILTLARASGHADGTVRVVRELALYANAKRNDVTFVLCDQESNDLRLISKEWLLSILEGAAKVDTSHFPDKSSTKQRLRERLPLALKNVLMWVGRPRRKAFLLLERIRLNSGFASSWAAWLQTLLLNDKYHRELPIVGGERRALLPYDMAISAKVEPTESDILVFTGSDYLSMHDQLQFARERGKPRIAVLCHDIIPLLFPQFFFRPNAETFRRCLHLAFNAADLMVFTGKKVLADSREYCQARGMTIRRSGVFTLGANYDPVAPEQHGALPSGLEHHRYALFVSTIEPRKGHRLLYDVWKKLLAAGVPQAHDFKLVFLGRQGWMVDDLIADLKADPIVGDSLIMLSNVDDSTLRQLYSNAAFCLYPSIYEGFGLPVIEGFRYGKAVISSTGGALPETVGGFSPCLDPADEQAWYDMLKSWIENPDARKPYEDAIKSKFMPLSWDRAAEDFFAVIDRELT